MLRKREVLMVVVGLIMALVACAPAATTPAPAPTRASAATPAAAAATTKPSAPTPTPAGVPPSPTPKPATLKYGTVRAIADVGVYVAAEKGYFQEQGITLDVQNVTSTAEAIPVLATGQLDLISGTFGRALLEAADRGIELKIVADMGQSRPTDLCIGC